MPCRPIDGRRGFLCGPGAAPKKCTYCGRPAGLLCDAVLGSGPRKGKTCDAPMCAQCTHRPAVNTDYCRDHRVPAEMRP
jgi:hypothetical protein